VHHLQSAFEEANSYSRYHPSKGYSWDLKERKVPERLAVKKETQREEPSSLFQRHRVDMLLAELTRKFPIPVAVQPQKHPAPGNGDKYTCIS
jgi:mediator of RNA polymerase II transcription subunit 6